ncbi:MAG: DUF563 domain-containing protein [Crocosphaera sp.]
MSGLKNLKQAKFFLQKKLRNTLIKQVDINKIAEEVKFLTLSEQKILTPEIQERQINYLDTEDSGEFYSLPPIYTAILRDIIYYGQYNSLFSTSKKLIFQSVISSGHFSKVDKLSLRKLYFGATKKLLGTYSVFRTMTTSSNYYHSLIDQIPRIYLLNQSEYKNEDIKLLISKPLNQVEQFFLDKLLPSNIRTNLVNPKQLYHLERLIFPSIMSRRKAGYLPKCYIDHLVSKVAPSRRRDKRNRILISRSKAQSRKVINEKELLNLLEDYGFKKYCLEDLTIEEQIELFYDAEIVIAPHGAGLANLIFSDKIHVLELFCDQEFRPHYYYLCKSLNHNYQYILNDRKKIDKIQKGFRVDLLKINEYLENMDSLR